MEVVLVSVIKFQKYLVHNIEQLLLLGYNVTLITEKKFFSSVSDFKIKLIDSDELDTDFDLKYKYLKKKKKIKIGEKNFFHGCSKRLFLLYEYLKKYNVKNVLHLENDVLLYTEFNFNYDKNKVYLTIDSENRCIPGIIYIPSYDLLNNLINNYNYKANDMDNMVNFYKKNKNICKTFPIIDNSISLSIYNENFEEFKSIFDAAAIGQYFGGTLSKKNRAPGFVNETCCIKYNKYKFKWIKKKKFYLPYIIIDDKLIPINCLHIHSKNLKDFLINDPDPTNEYISI